jgi:hypothetical protein
MHIFFWQQGEVSTMDPEGWNTGDVCSIHPDKSGMCLRDLPKDENNTIELFCWDIFAITLW